MTDDDLAYNFGLEVRYAIAAAGVDPIHHIPEVDEIIKRLIAEIRSFALTNTSDEAVSRQALRAIRYLAESPSGREPHDRFSMIAAYCEQGLEEDARPQPAAVRDEATSLPQDVINLVIAAREFWDANNDLSPESLALDVALDGFARRVPFDNEPDALHSTQEG